MVSTGTTLADMVKPVTRTPRAAEPDGRVAKYRRAQYRRVKNRCASISAPTRA